MIKVIIYLALALVNAALFCQALSAMVTLLEVQARTPGMQTVLTWLIIATISLGLNVLALLSRVPAKV